MLAYYQELFGLMTLNPDAKAERLYADFMMGKNIRKLWKTKPWKRKGKFLQHGSLHESGRAESTPL